MQSDNELFQRWQDGDKGAGSELFQRHFDSLCRFFANKVGSDIDDLVQRTFQACVSSRDRFAMRSSFRTYMFAIARNELYHHLREQRRAKERLDFTVTSLRDLGITPRTQLDRNQHYQALARALRSLPIEQQVLLELRYWEDMRSEELAEVMGITVGAVDDRLLRARKTLGTRLRKQLDAASVDGKPVTDLDSWARGVRDAWHAAHPDEARSRATKQPDASDDER